ncbi:hypothetical protein K470DRAFT_65200 [Piedraia hortae CBS 480.64]|uniref:Uncharacterized protein n=1 Tax=Piedraia hortae CBS 480.64 TaxID=1314780 RepID=A0A6A7BZP2_9PEZI|nr:hypothetical protein K470DRAFT_65200 [Piedraia hortae CBS 480.64]
MPVTVQHFCAGTRRIQGGICVANACAAALWHMASSRFPGGYVASLKNIRPYQALTCSREKKGNRLAHDVQRKPNGWWLVVRSVYPLDCCRIAVGGKLPNGSRDPLPPPTPPLPRSLAKSAYQALSLDAAMRTAKSLSPPVWIGSRVWKSLGSTTSSHRSACTLLGIYTAGIWKND